MSSPEKRSSPPPVTEEQAKAEIREIIGQVEAARERLKATYEAMPEAEDEAAELESFRWAVGFHVGDLDETPTDTTFADLINVLQMALEWSPWEGEEPPEYTRLREAAAKAANTIEAAQAELVETIKQIPVPDPPMLNGRPLNNPFEWTRGGILDNASGKHGAVPEAIKVLRLDADNSYNGALEEMFAGGSPWAEEGESDTGGGP